jgi:hypothetical protein
LISEGFIDWLCLSAALLFAGSILSHTSFRPIDLVGAQALARWPTIFAALIALPKGSQRFANHLMELVKRQGQNLQSPGASPAAQFVTTDALIFAVVALGNHSDSLLDCVLDVQGVLRLMQLEGTKSSPQFYRGIDRSGNLV